MSIERGADGGVIEYIMRIVAIGDVAGGNPDADRGSLGAIAERHMDRKIAEESGIHGKINGEARGIRGTQIILVPIDIGIGKARMNVKERGKYKFQRDVQKTP